MATTRIKEEPKSEAPKLLVPDRAPDLIVEVAGQGACYNDGSPLGSKDVEVPTPPQEAIAGPVEDDTKEGA